MTKKQEFENKLNFYKKAFCHKCLFCQQLIESANFPKRENQTIISTCEFCYNGYEFLSEEKAKYTEFEKCFYSNCCYFCSEKTFVSDGRYNTITQGVE